ncbi:MAG: hypothetical protein QME47_02100, partial [Candidatus Thermoplasmatota archaeon]|nr:hypothetical protein [Candidatus Thermoplasmatota archaeon]
YTHSLSYAIRVWLFIIAVLLYNLWLLITAEIRKLCFRVSSHQTSITKYQFKFMSILGHIFVTLKDGPG